MSDGEFAEDLAAVMNRLMERHCELHGWEIIGLDTGEIEIRTQHDGNFRLTVQSFEDDE